MNYLNPLAVLEISPEAAAEGLSTAFLKKHKKRLLAEFELNDTTTIELRGQELDRTAVLQLFESLEDESQLAHHVIILKETSLQAFLEEASLDYFYSRDVAQLAAHSNDFLKFIGPFYARQFNRRLVNALKQKDWEEIQLMCQFPLSIPTRYHAVSYQDAYRFLHAKIQEIESQTETISKGKAPGGEIQEFCDEMLITAMNHLPAYFAGTRDSYAIALEGLAIAVHNEHRRASLGVFILKQGMKLSISADAQARLQHILDQLMAMAPSDNLFDWFGGDDKEKESVNPWMVALGVGAGVAGWLLYRWLK